MRVAVIIPTWKARPWLARQLAALASQELRPATVVVVDSSSPDGSAELARRHGCRVEVIPQAEFDHGGTRNRGAALAGEAEVLCFLTQDALPVSPRFLAALVAPIAAGHAAAAYARQLPYPSASPIEAFVRGWNYPAEPELRDAGALERRGVRACFFSNVASAVARADFQAVGGFPERTVMNEDMVLCARLLRSGRRVAYAAAAEVRHSHDYTLRQHFARYLDIGAFFARFGDLVPSGGAGGEGQRLVRALVLHLQRSGHAGLVPRALAESAAKLLGWQAGRRERWLPNWFKRRMGMHGAFWAREGRP
jgi:rhamnosyltransferase